MIDEEMIVSCFVAGVCVMVTVSFVIKKVA